VFKLEDLLWKKDAAKVLRELRSHNEILPGLNLIEKHRIIEHSKVCSSSAMYNIAAWL
jgi:hypothetical protein